MTAETDPVLVYVTTSSVEEAKRLGTAAVEARLAAAANVIGGMMSIHRWAGGMTESLEAGLMLKTVRGRVAALTADLRSRHSYDLPAIVVLPIEGGHQEYLDWIAAETRDRA
jgi:periplasmic divalent cation tolerance protein